MLNLGELDGHGEWTMVTAAYRVDLHCSKVVSRIARTGSVNEIAMKNLCVELMLSLCLCIRLSSTSSSL